MVEVGRQIAADGDLVPRPHARACTHDGDLRGPVDVEHAPAGRPDVQDVLAQRLSADVKDAQVRKGVGGDVCARARHRPQVRGHGHHHVDALACQPTDHVWSRTLHHVGDDDTGAPLVHGAVHLGYVVVERHGGHLCQAVVVLHPNEVAPDPDQVAGRPVLDHHGFGLSGRAAGEDDVAEPGEVGLPLAGLRQRVRPALALADRLVDVQDVARVRPVDLPAWLLETKLGHDRLRGDHDRVLRDLDPRPQLLARLCHVERVVDAAFEHRCVHRDQALRAALQRDAHRVLVSAAAMEARRLVTVPAAVLRRNDLVAPVQGAPQNHLHGGHHLDQLRVGVASDLRLDGDPVRLMLRGNQKKVCQVRLRVDGRITHLGDLPAVRRHCLGTGKGGDEYWAIANALKTANA
mmetsp:Transcript_87968/g.196661  ORF Transcript_87968/g.196661 Transcript_87968/m.196661 type:complete len:405 (+) Transcript_87968:887-2101(+)